MGSPSPREGDDVILRTMRLPLESIRGQIARLVPTRMIVSTRLEPWMAPGSELECTIIGASGTVSVRCVVRALSPLDDHTVEVTVPEPLELVDRRQHARKPLTGEVTWAALGSNGEMGPPRPGHMVNISAGGMLFRTVMSPLERDGIIAVSFTMSGEPLTCLTSAIQVDDLRAPVNGCSQVVHARMVAIDDRQRELIEAYVEADEDLHAPFRLRVQ